MHSGISFVKSIELYLHHLDKIKEKSMLIDDPTEEDKVVIDNLNSTIKHIRDFHLRSRDFTDSILNHYSSINSPKE
jgi:hypothetical protein